MAEALRKNIYVAQEDAMFFLECEKYAKEKSIPMSNLIIRSLRKYMKNIDNSIVTLIIKKGKENDKLGEYKKIQFKGKKITSTDIILNEKNDPIKGIKTNLQVYNNDELVHKYVFYKSESGKLVMYIRKLHLRDNSLVGEYGIPNYDDCEIIEEESEYRIFHNVNEVVNEFWDIPNNCINELILEMAETEILDI